MKSSGQKQSENPAKNKPREYKLREQKLNVECKKNPQIH